MQIHFAEPRSAVTRPKNNAASQVPKVLWKAVPGESELLVWLHVKKENSPDENIMADTAFQMIFI